jgi:hypothetical protein
MIKYRFCNIATQRVFCCVNAPSRKSSNDRYQTVSCKTWNPGILESWNLGILESWNPGILSYNRRICYYQDIIIILMQHIVLYAII